MADIVSCMETFLEKKKNMDDMERLGIVTAGSYEYEFLDLRERTARYKTEGTYKTSDGEKPANVVKNRYKDIMPYDHKRVILNVNAESKRTDYINASKIEGAVIGQNYIAAQGPLPGTVVDFWDMIWQYKVKVVVMACNEIESGKLRCKRYWPNDGKEVLKFGDITVTLTEEVEAKFKEYRVRYLRVFGPGNNGEQQQQQRDIVQLHYTAWPDRGVPQCTESLWHMIYTLRDHQPLSVNHQNTQHDSPTSSPGTDADGDVPPVVVHCSAGCGRTGTILVLDFVNALLKFGKLNDKFSLYNIISDMRQQRMAIVQSQEQYVFVHEAVADLFNRQLALINGHLYENVASRISADSATVAEQTMTKSSHASKSSSLPRPPTKSGPTTRTSSVKKSNGVASPSLPNSNLIDLVDFSSEYRAPPASPPTPFKDSPANYKEPYDSRLHDEQNRKPLKVHNIWSPVRHLSETTSIEPADGYAEVKHGACSAKPSASDSGENTNSQKSGRAAGENTNSKRSGSLRSSNNSADDKTQTESGYYSYANPDGNKWSLQEVARREGKWASPEAGPEGDQWEPGYASVNVSAITTNQTSNRIEEPKHFTDGESLSAAVPERRPNNSTSDDGKLLGMMSKAKHLFGLTSKSQEPPLQIHQQQQSAVSVRQPSSSSCNSSFQPEKVVYHGHVISYPNRIGKRPRGKRALVENHAQ